MTAIEIVEAIFNRQVFAGNNNRPKGYMGIVDVFRGTVQTMWSEDLMHDDHSIMGRGPNALRWRYAVNRVIPIVLWSGDPSEYPSVKSIVETWLDVKGLRVAGHTIDFNKWMGY